MRAHGLDRLLQAVAAGYNATGEFHACGFERMKVAALVLGAFAGLGHIVLGQALKGAVFGLLFIICLNGLFLGKVVLLGTVSTTVFWSSAGCAAAVWVIAYRDLVLSLRTPAKEG